MKKRALMILMTFILGSAGTLSPVCYAAAQESAAQETQEDGEKSIFEQGAEIGSELYEKMDEAVDNVDKASLRKKIREALEELDERGISPSVIAENTFGIRTVAKQKGKMPENTLIEEAQKTVKKKTEGFFTMLWNGFLDTLESMITTGFSLFSEAASQGAKGGSK